MLQPPGRNCCDQLVQYKTNVSGKEIGTLFRHCSGLKPRTHNLAVHSCHVGVSRASVAFVVVCVTTWMCAICFFQKITDVRPFVFVIQLKKLAFL